MKKLICLILLLPLFTTAQIFTKNDLAICSLSFVAGAANGVEEAIKFHYNRGFAFVHPNASRQYWDPRVSWTNKDHSSFSRLIPTFSDGYHLMRGISRVALIADIAISINDLKGKRPLLIFAKKFILSMIANRAGQYLTYDIIYRERK